MTPQPDPPADPFSPLMRFRDCHAGQRVVVVCNGPSLNDMGDLGFLRGEIVFGLNKIHLGLERFGFYPRYLVAVNDRVIEQSAEAFRRMTCVKFLSERAATLFPQDAFTHHIRTTGLSGRFYRDVTEGVREGHTVTHAALQLARWMGAAEVVIIGMDHRYETSSAPNAPSRLEGPDPNHFAPEYFSGQTWDAPNLAENEISYAVAREVFEAEGRRIIDATPGGACKIFSKADFREVFGL